MTGASPLRTWKAHLQARRARRMRKALLRAGEEQALRVGWPGRGQRYVDEVVCQLERDWAGGSTRHVDWVLATAWTCMPRSLTSSTLLAAAGAIAALAGNIPAATAAMAVAVLYTRRSASERDIADLLTSQALHACFLRSQGHQLPARILTQPLAQQILLTGNADVDDIAVKLADEYDGTVSELLHASHLLSRTAPGIPTVPQQHAP